MKRVFELRREYRFRDLPSRKEMEMNQLQRALFQRRTDKSACTATIGWTEPVVDISSCSSNRTGNPTVSSSLNRLSGGEYCIAPHSPQRGEDAAGLPPQHAPPPYALPPLSNLPPQHQWPVAPPNVYVNQMTANVNVRGNMGQYYQPPQPQYSMPPAERPPRPHRREPDASPQYPPTPYVQPPPQHAPTPYVQPPPQHAPTTYVQPPPQHMPTPYVQPPPQHAPTPYVQPPPQHAPTPHVQPPPQHAPTPYVQPPPQHAPTPYVQPPPQHVPTPYVQPPPPTYPPPKHQWPVAPPNVYVNHVTANVNVGQYNEPPQSQYPTHPAERPSRPSSCESQVNRAPSPSPQPPPCYVQYPQYYPAAQAQGAPLYQHPTYQPHVYGPYDLPPYYHPQYPMPVESGENGPEEYQQEVVMEQEAVDICNAGAHCAYAPPVESGMEYMPPIYLPPPSHPQPMPIPSRLQSTPYELNVHAETFVPRQNKVYIPPENMTQDLQKPPPVTGTNNATALATAPVDSLPMKDVKITSKGPSSPKQSKRPPNATKKPATTPTEKVSEWTPGENKAPEPVSNNQTAITNKTFPVTTSSNNQVSTVSKVPRTIGKTSKGPAAPFTGGKQFSKASVPQTVVPVQQAASTPNSPFGNRQTREATTNRSPSNDNTERTSVSIEQHPKREPSLSPSKAPMPISITMHSAGQPLILSNKSPFGHSRQAAAAPEPPPVPQPPPPAPTASDIPPPPTPRNHGEPISPPVIQPQPQPAPGKSWASLFSNKTAITTSAPPRTAEVKEPSSPITTTPLPTAPNGQKPVAKVPPFEGSPVHAVIIDKRLSTPRSVTTSAVPAVFYSENTSDRQNTGSNNSTEAKLAETTQAPAEVRVVPTQKEPTPALRIQTSPFRDDPNSYRVGEFLSKYQLDNRPVSLQPRGLTNRSNYCYVNAILQALIACPPFYNLLKALPYQTGRGKSSTPVIDSMVELCYEYSASVPAAAVAGVAGAGRGARVPVCPLPVPAGPPLDSGAGLRVLRALRFPGSQEDCQEDAEEFLGCLLNSLNDEMLELMKLVEPEEPKDNNGQPNGVIAQEHQSEEDDDDEWKVMGPRNRGAVERHWAARRTPVADIFRGQTRVRLHRASNHDITDAMQPFFTLQLDIERASSVKDALGLLAGKDTLEGDADAWQQLSLDQLPVVLLLHLKCFQLDPEGHTAKLVKNIDFSIDLKIDPKIMSSKLKYTPKQRLYKLFAVVYHEGVEAVKGHYLTDTYHGQVGWIRYDDSRVTRVSSAQVMKPKAPRMPYLLMYRRCDTLPPHRASKLE